MATPFTMSFVQVAADGPGKYVDAVSLSNGSQTVQRQVVCLGDPVDHGLTPRVMASNPLGSEDGLVVRTIPSGTQTIQGVQDTAAAGTITSSSSVVGPLSVVQRNVITVTITGTYAGVSFIVEASDNGGTTWFPLQCIDNNTGQAGSAWTPGTNASASYDSAVGGYTHLRVRATAWTSGSASVRLTAQSFAYDPVVASLSQGLAGNGTAVRGFPVLVAGWNGTNAYTLRTDANGNQTVAQVLGTAATRWFTQLSDGTNSPAIKAASTPAAATDPALTVTLSPNSPAPATALAAQACLAKVLNGIGAATNIKASAGNVFGMSLINNNAAAVYVEIFDAASVTLGTTTPVAVFLIPASGVLNISPSALACVACATQIFIAAVTAYNGTTTGSVTGTVFYK